MSRHLLTTLALTATLAGAPACGGDDTATLVDGATAPDAGSDGAPVDCVGEHEDDRNGSTAEATGLTFAGTRVAVCGSVDLGHSSGDLIDLDLYQLTVAPSAPVVVRLTAPLGAELDRLELIVRDGAGPRALARVRAGNAVTALLLPQGEYTLGVEARSAGATIPIPYRLEVYADQPALRCPAMPGGTIRNEVDESAAQHRANDVVEVRGAPPLVQAQATAATGDAPDVSGQAVSAGGRFTIAGVSAAVASAGDDYLDRDTFSFYTGASTNQLDARVTWTGNIADLDVLIFEAGKPGDPMGTPSPALIGEEVIVTTVEPSKQYWLWVGGSRRSTALPVTYAVQVCGHELAAAPAAN